VRAWLLVYEEWVQGHGKEAHSKLTQQNNLINFRRRGSSVGGCHKTLAAAVSSSDFTNRQVEAGSGNQHSGKSRNEGAKGKMFLSQYIYKLVNMFKVNKIPVLE
jgi:hypothetical protein